MNMLEACTPAMVEAVADLKSVNAEGFSSAALTLEIVDCAKKESTWFCVEGIALGCRDGWREGTRYGCSEGC